MHTLHADLILDCVKTHTSEQLGNASRQYLLHDGCDLRKADSQHLEYLGHVLSLSKQGIRGYKTMNAFFLVGFFPELEEQLKKHPLAQNLCALTHSKGKVTIPFLLKGLERLVHFQEVTQWMEQENISKEQVDEMLQNISTGFNSA